MRRGDSLLQSMFKYSFNSNTIAALSFLCSADSLEEIVGLDISYHGDFRARSTERDDSINDEDERAYYERREQHREKQRNKIRRRILMMDFSLSRGRNSVSSAEEDRPGYVENPHGDQGLPTARLTI